MFESRSPLSCSDCQKDNFVNQSSNIIDVESDPSLSSVVSRIADNVQTNPSRAACHGDRNFISSGGFFIQTRGVYCDEYICPPPPPLIIIMIMIIIIIGSYKNIKKRRNPTQGPGPRYSLCIHVCVTKNTISLVDKKSVIYKIKH